MARRMDPCAGLRKRVAETEASIQDKVTLLSELAPRERRRVLAEIEKEKRILRLLLSLLRACEREHAASKRPSRTPARPPVKRR